MNSHKCHKCQKVYTDSEKLKHHERKHVVGRFEDIEGGKQKRKKSPVVKRKSPAAKRKSPSTKRKSPSAKKKSKK